MKKMSLLMQLILAIGMGVILGVTMGAISGSVGPEQQVWVQMPIRILATFNGLFGNFLKFVVPLLVLSFVTVGIGQLGQNAGKMLGLTVLVAYSSTVIFATLSFLFNSITFPIILQGQSLSTDLLTNPEDFLLNSYFKVAMPPIMDVVSSLVLAFVLGLGITAFGQENPLYRGFEVFQKIIERLLSDLIIPLLPFHILGVFANMSYNGRAFDILQTMAVVFVIVILFHWVTIGSLYTIAGSLSKRNPLKMIKTMLPVYGAAIGTQSSVATIPVTLAQVKKLGVPSEVANFTVPLLATIHMPGSAITIASCALALAYVLDFPVTYMQMQTFILMAGIMAVAAPGTPGGVIMATLGALATYLGFNEVMLSLMIALYLAQDSFGTATNVTGDGAITVIVTRIMGRKLEPQQVKEVI